MKIIKNQENAKTQKSDKTRKWKSTKSDKIKKWKSVKKVSKFEVPLKTPKCHLNGQNRHFVKSEPPGWALFEFQGVPRDPVLRPKMTPSILNVKCDHVFWFSSFSCWSFSHFWWFMFCDKLIKCCEVLILWHNGLMHNKALRWLHRRGDKIMCGGSPLFQVG